jgi:hypothetical protein
MDIKFEDIQKANESIATTNIRGSEYAEVNQRIKAFRMVYPTGFITTEMTSNENGVCVFRASVGYVDNLDRVVLGTGTAYEKEGSSFINKFSYIENAETSCVGRALGMAGFGIDTSIASYEEVANAVENQNKPDNIDKKKAEVKKSKASAEQKKAAELKSKVDMIKKYVASSAEKKEAYLEYIKANNIHKTEDITEEHANALLKMLGDSK